ncbi:MAG: hypothetical protein FWC24_00985 [Treponema sp.]|nr:hypothetical protein [Treponema sp.]
MKHVFIIEPAAFYDQQWRMDNLLDSIGQFFRTQEKPNFSTLVSHFPRDAIKLIQKQVDEAEEYETVRVYALGGDSLLYDCLNGITGLPNIELAVVPFGDTNSFIRVFGEKKAELFKDIPSLAESDTIIPTDIIAVGNNFAINGCSVGLTPALAMQKKDTRMKLSKGIGRFFVGFWYILYSLTSLFSKELTARQYKITIDDDDYSGTYSLVNVMNSPYFGRGKTALALPGSTLDDGLLDVLLFKSVNSLATHWFLNNYSRGNMPSNCVCLQAKKIEIKSERPMWIQADNEFFVDTHITFEVVPEGVRIAAPNGLTYQGLST